MYSRKFARRNRNVVPIRFGADPLGENTPLRDPYVSPDHAMYIGEILIPARCLANGTSIQQVGDLDCIEYIHIELDSHDVIFAEGAASETFVDDDSRAMLHNADDYTRRFPGAITTPAVYYASRVSEGADLAAIWDFLASRAHVPVTA